MNWPWSHLPRDDCNNPLLRLAGVPPQLRLLSGAVPGEFC